MPRFVAGSGWITLTEAQRRLAIGRGALLTLIARGELGSRAIPCSRPLVCEADVARVGLESTRLATPSRSEATPCAG